MKTFIIFLTILCNSILEFWKEAGKNVSRIVGVWTLLIIPFIYFIKWINDFDFHFLVAMLFIWPIAALLALIGFYILNKNYIIDSWNEAKRRSP